MEALNTNALRRTTTHDAVPTVDTQDVLAAIAANDGQRIQLLTTRMRPLGEFEVPEVLEARHELEVTCARLAAERNEEPELDVMAKEIETQKNSAISDVDFCASDVRFHRAMADASHNPVLRFVMFAVIEALQPIENMVVFRFREREEIVKQHEKMLAALKARDTEAVVAAVTEQTEYLRERFDAAQEWKRQRTEN